MSLVRKAPRSAIVVRTVAFGSLDGSIWGAGLDAGVPAVVASGGAEPVAVALAWNVDSPAWELSGDGIALTASPDLRTPATGRGRRIAVTRRCRA